MKWEQDPLGDWKLMDANGVLIGKVVFQDHDGKRVWYTVSMRLDHGPEEARLTVGKRRLEALWDAFQKGGGVAP